MEHKLNHFMGAGGLQLHGEAWLPEDSPKAVLAIVHGLCEHCRRYTNLVNHLVYNGYAVYGFDHRGHGHTGGRHGHITQWKEYRLDVHGFLKWVGEQQPEKPLFLYGHSLGALIVLDYLMRPPMRDIRIQGAILSGSPNEPAGVGTRTQIALARAVSRVWPGLTMKLDLSEKISRDPVVVQAYRADPFVHQKATARFAVEARKAVNWVNANPDKLTLPVLFVHGGSDPLNTVEGARRFFEQISSLDKKFYVYPGSYHEVHNDLDYKQVMADIETWIEERR